ncbi:hypothetical protein JWG44_05510 [Leptospira sp. 201903071]|uniref:hypothetical protein n=1 Tax=Leptospira ainazelensis TaxID=2810034 RepID=UPI001965DA82|nr:hypothetical protein [Leptospira ainazelensis]MBM9499707.1 hypothetical protein [Leptospira ainazelensis]
MEEEAPEFWQYIGRGDLQISKSYSEAKKQCDRLRFFIEIARPLNKEAPFPLERKRGWRKGHDAL